MIFSARHERARAARAAARSRRAACRRCASAPTERASNGSKWMSDARSRSACVKKRVDQPDDRRVRRRLSSRSSTRGISCSRRVEVRVARQVVGQRSPPRRRRRRCRRAPAARRMRSASTGARRERHAAARAATRRCRRRVASARSAARSTASPSSRRRQHAVRPGERVGNALRVALRRGSTGSGVGLDARRRGAARLLAPVGDCGGGVAPAAAGIGWQSQRRAARDRPERGGCRISPARRGCSRSGPP